MPTATEAKVATTTWKIDPVHSHAQFKVKHMMISNVKGEFSGVSGTLTLDEGDIRNSKIEASIDAGSLNTKDAQRDGHLKSADFLDVEKYPDLRFQSTEVARNEDGDLAVSGNLAIHGVTRPAVLVIEEMSAAAKDPWGNTRIGLSAATKINRKDFGLTWNTALETGGVLVGEEVTITLDVEFLKA
jgi:polyisoprenoid-binding protein YceI